MADATVVETVGLQKRYQAVEALRGLDLRVPAGAIFGFLGRNGAGKTTTIKILLGMVRPSGGRATVFGLAADHAASSVEIRRRAAFVSDEKDLYDSMTVDEMIRFTAGFFPKWRDDLEREYLRRFELPRDRTVKALSRGMRTKLALLLSLSRGAEVLVLDEPTAGLDPAMTEEVLQALVGHAATEGMTIFFSSHQIAEVDQIADSVAIIDRGRTVVAGALDDLRENFRRVQLVFDSEAPAAAFQAPGNARVKRSGRVLTVLSTAGAEPVLDRARALHPVSMDVVPVTLKEIFLESVTSED
ncbi:MAG TPA: ABC transporter ATP-binding protein [Vicinamibacterales bacterium]|nr:ABC transporter ATP-binding protein [Vicinamibacterales bacterium]